MRLRNAQLFIPRRGNERWICHNFSVKSNTSDATPIQLVCRRTATAFLTSTSKETNPF
jgi:hypothetical protein